MIDVIVDDRMTFLLVPRHHFRCIGKRVPAQIWHLEGGEKHRLEKELTRKPGFDSENKN